MKTLKTILLVLLTISTLLSCDNDSDPAPNDDICEYQGLTFLDTANSTETLIPESDLTTDFFHSSSNGPEVEIYETSNPGNFNFTTTIVTVGSTGTGILNLNGSTYNVNVTCQRTGSAIGEEMRFDVTTSGIEVEFCVLIDAYH